MKVGAAGNGSENRKVRPIRSVRGSIVLEGMDP